jgi:hypothetical protein
LASASVRRLVVRSGGVPGVVAFIVACTSLDSWYKGKLQQVSEPRPSGVAALSVNMLVPLSVSFGDGMTIAVSPRTARISSAGSSSVDASDVSAALKPKKTSGASVAEGDCRTQSVVPLRRAHYVNASAHPRKQLHRCRSNSHGKPPSDTAEVGSDICTAATVSREVGCWLPT